MQQNFSSSDQSNDLLDVDITSNQQLQQQQDDFQMQQVGEQRIQNDNNNINIFPQTNAMKAQVADQKRAQIQANNLPQQNANQFKQPIQQQQKIQQQQVPRQQQQKNKKNYQIQQQQQSPGFFDQVKNFVSGVFGGDDIPKYKDERKTANHSFSDDDDVIVKDQIQQQLQVEIDKLIEFKIEAQYNYSKLKKTENQLLPAMVSIITKDIEQYAKNNQEIEAGIDLICIIDKSGSMSGTKIESVQKSIVQLLEFLSEKDRLCLITFDSTATRLTPLKTLTKENKKYFIGATRSIQAGGGTNIASGTELAFKQIKERKSRNQVTSIFVLSDGQDSGAQSRVQQQKDSINDVVTIHTFGYGSDHDATLMSSISKVGQGSFYYIQDVKLLDEFFADALGRLASALAEKLQLEIKCNPQDPFQNILIKKTYGDMWKVINNQRHYQINLPQIASDTRKDFVLQIELPAYNNQILDYQREPILIEATLQFQDTFTKQKFNKVTQLQLKLYNEDEQIGENDPNEDVTREFLRVEATDVIEQARLKCEQSKNEEAEEMLQKVQKQIMTDQRLAKVSAQAFQDLEQAKNAVKRKNYSNYGSKQMCQMAYNNYQQEGLNAVFDDFGSQQQQLDQAMFQNKKQKRMVEKVQSKKA